MKERRIIIVGGFGRIALDLANALEASKKLSIAADMSVEHAKDVVANAKFMAEQQSLQVNTELRLIELRKEIEAIKMQEEISITQKPHKDRYYQRHCRRNNWKK